MLSHFKSPYIAGAALTNWCGSFYRIFNGQHIIAAGFSANALVLPQGK
jgi:hypothetical protein